MADKTVSKAEALPTQEFVEIKAIQDGILILKNSSLRQVIMVSGINFDLKSEGEQESIIAAYQNFLNSLDFSIQIFIHSRKLNIDQYIKHLGTLEIKEGNPLLRNQISEYREFIRSFVSENAIMNKSFFLTVPFDPVHIPKAGKKATKKVFKFLSKEKTDPSVSGEADLHIEQYRSQLEQRVDQVISGLNTVGLRAVALNNEETVELFYNLYNPASIEKDTLEINKSNQTLDFNEQTN